MLVVEEEKKNDRIKQKITIARKMSAKAFVHGEWWCQGKWSIEQDFYSFTGRFLHYVVRTGEVLFKQKNKHIYIYTYM